MYFFSDTLYFHPRFQTFFSFIQNFFFFFLTLCQMMQYFIFCGAYNILQSIHLTDAFAPGTWEEDKNAKKNPHWLSDTCWLTECVSIFVGSNYPKKCLHEQHLRKPLPSNENWCKMLPASRKVSWHPCATKCITPAIRIIWLNSNF